MINFIICDDEEIFRESLKEKIDSCMMQTTIEYKTHFFDCYDRKFKDFTENIIYEKLLSDKLDTDLGYLYENVVAQMLYASGNRLFYYTFPKEGTNHKFEIDFLIAKKNKICPIEVMSY